MDGKHAVIQAPAKSGSLFSNYKKNFSIVLLAFCDASYQFTAVDIGEAGKQSDGGVFANSNLGRSMVNASQIIENIFGILAARFRIFHWPILSCLEMIENITKACAGDVGKRRLWVDSSIKKLFKNSLNFPLNLSKNAYLRRHLISFARGQDKLY